MVKAKNELDMLGEITSGKIVAVIAAGGSSQRMQGIDKQFYELCGIPVIIRSIMAFEECDFVNSIVVVSSSDNVLRLQGMLQSYRLNKVTDIIEGGSCRAESVKLGVEAAGDDADILLIHDGGRPLVSRAIIESVKDAVELYGAAACAVPLKDTIKKTDITGKIIETPDRRDLSAVQTPQGFKAQIYKNALKSIKDIDETITDDCMLVEGLGYPVYTVEGSYDNIKITNPIDLIIAEAILKERGDKA